MSYLFAAGVGPVQDFIAAARRSRDLWFGSWLLSEISKAAAKALAENCGRDACDRRCLIFPAVGSGDDLEPVEYRGEERVKGNGFNVVNKLVAQVETDPHALAENIMRPAMAARLEEIRAQAFGSLDLRFIDSSTAAKQVADLIEFYWAAQPLRDAADYGAARAEVEAALAARKNLRDFRQVTQNPADPCGWGSSARKSSLDGQRESVLLKSADSLLPDERRRKLGLRPSEQLCGVGLLKRHGNRRGDGSFFSTSHVAALPLLESLARKDEAAKARDRAAVGEYVFRLAEMLEVLTPAEAQSLRDEAGRANQSPELPPGKKRAMQGEVGFVPKRAARAAHEVFGRWDGHLLFEERLRDFFPDENRLKQAKEALRKFLTVTFNDERPKPYYALLLADGDRMGEAIDARNSISDHRRLSQKLSGFSSLVRAVVEGGEVGDGRAERGHGGSLIYSGGDDVLAFLPLHQALFCARRLAEEFRDAMREFTYTDRDEIERQPTLSVGLAVGHHLDPLSDTLELARRAEKVAKKQVAGKNALAVVVSKRGGVDWTVRGSWDGAREGTALDARLNHFIYLLLAGELPRGLGYELRDAALRLGGPALDAALRDEAVRILGRKRVGGGAGVSDTVFGRLEGYLRNGKLSVGDTAYELIVARPFAGAFRQAGVGAEEFAALAALTRGDATSGER